MPTFQSSPRRKRFSFFNRSPLQQARKRILGKLQGKIFAPTTRLTREDLKDLGDAYCTSYSEDQKSNRHSNHDAAKALSNNSCTTELECLESLVRQFRKCNCNTISPGSLQKSILVIFNQVMRNFGIDVIQTHKVQTDGREAHTIERQPIELFCDMRTCLMQNRRQIELKTENFAFNPGSRAFSFHEAL